jgi:hypothetical protein
MMLLVIVTIAAQQAVLGEARVALGLRLHPLGPLLSVPSVDILEGQTHTHGR